MRKIFRRPNWLALITLVLVVLVPTLPLFHLSGSPVVYAAGKSRGPLIPHLTHHTKPRPHHSGSGVSRTHLPALTVLTKHTKRAGTSVKHPHGALISANANPNMTTTLFFDDMESGAPGWTTVGDNNRTSYYPTGHDFWNLAQNPNLLSVPGSVNPTLVSYPDSTGTLPAAYSGTHAWWYGDNPAVDTPNPSGASITYMGNQSDWPSETSGDGGTSNGPNTAALITPTIDLTSAPNATLTFATWWEIESVNPAHFDMMFVDVSTDGGNTWTSVGVLNPTNDPSGGADPYPYTSSGLDAPASWQVASVNLTSYAGSKVQVRFRFDSVDQFFNGFRGWFIDDVGVYSADAGTPLVSTVTPNTGAVGDTVTISGSSFGAQQNGSTVTFNGVTAPIQSWSDTSIVATIPAGATSGPLIVTVNGVQSFAVSFTINASISLSSPTASPLTVDSVSGKGFAAGEPIAIYVNGVNGTQLASATADSNGNLPSTNITIPKIPGGNHLVLAAGQNSHTTAGTTLSVVPALSSSVSTVKTSQTITLSAVGFAANDSVPLQLDSTNSPNLGSLSCDSNGVCTGSATMPSSSVVQGMHLLIASSSSGLIAEAPIFFTPSLSLSINYGGEKHSAAPATSSFNVSGGPGTSLILNGTAFTANETVQIYWGSTSGIPEGTTTTDSQGNLSFYFNAPTSLAPGKYTITVARTHQKPATVTTSFIVLAPKMTSTGGIHSGQPVTAQLKGFQAFENVTISWNANGGQQLTTFGMDAAGAGSGTFTPPSAPLGSYTLTATGSSSGLQATSSLHVGPGIQLLPNTSNPGNTITVNGGGYTAGETVNVYFQNTANGVVPATVDPTGAFSVALKIPIFYKSSVAYSVYAVNSTKTEKASARFYYILPAVYSSNYYVTYGSQTTLYGQGFASNEAVKLYWNYKQAGQINVGTATAASDGSFSFATTVPSDPNLGSVAIAAVGATSKLTATSSVYEYAGLVLTPSSGPPGTTVNVNGGGFGSAETVTIFYQGASVGTATTDTTGAFTSSFVVPTNASLGNNYVSASGSTSGVSASTYFYVTPSVTINPTTGPSGTPITVTGNYFTPNGSVYLYWYDPSTGSYTFFGTFNTSSSGTFTASITAPAGLTSGNTYYVQAYDGPTGILAQAAFVAQ